MKNGYNSVCTPKFLCKTCGRQCVENPKQRRISDKNKSLVDKLLLERISLAGIARVCEVSERWLQNYVNEKYRPVPLDGKVIAKSSHRLTIQCDGMWSFVGKCDNEQWIWLALDRYTREIVGVHMGDISADSAQSLWDSLPTIYQQHAISYADFWQAYHAVFPKNRHHAVGKESGKKIISSGSTAHFANGYQDGSEKPCPSQKKSKTMLARFLILYTITMTR